MDEERCTMRSHGDVLIFDDGSHVGRRMHGDVFFFEQLHNFDLSFGSFNVFSVLIFPPILAYLTQLQEKLLRMRSNLRTCPGSNVFFDLLPIFAELDQSLLTTNMYLARIFDVLLSTIVLTLSTAP